MSLAADSAFALPHRSADWRAWAVFPFLAGFLVLTWWALTRFLPDHATFHLLGRTLALIHIHDKLLGDAAIALGLVPLVLWLECALIGWNRSSARAEASSMETFLAALARTHGGAHGWARAAGLGDDVLDGLREVLVESPPA